MARSLTAREEAIAQSAWPRMNTAAVVVTDEATSAYNCIAWTLGITTSWIWPWPSQIVTKAEFDAFYTSNGFVPSGSGPVAVFGLNAGNMTHGSISGPGHGPRWESKCGVWLRIQHGLGEMEGGSLYGNVLGFYSRTSGKLAIAPDAAERLQAMKPEKLTKTDLKFVKERVGGVAPELRGRFERAYAAWKEAIAHPLIAISSDPAIRTHTPAFLELVSLGPVILPLLMEKLTHPDEFFALQAVDRLNRPEFVVSRAPDDPAVLLGEQGRAVETVKQWVRTEA
jgi:hypothetical protein